MTSKWFLNRQRQLPRIELALAACHALLMLLAAAAVILSSPLAQAGNEAPAWMHALVNVQLPSYPDKTDAVLLYSERIVNVQSAEKIRTTVRETYKILRPGGRDYGTLVVSFNSHKKITGMRGWCIPSQGKDYEVKGKEAVEISHPKIAGSELISDVRDTWSIRLSYFFFGLGWALGLATNMFGGGSSETA